MLADVQRVARVQVHDAVVLEEHGRHPVAGCREQEAVIKADLQRPWLDVLVPVDTAVAKAEVPFADDSRRVTGALEHRRDRRLAGPDDGRCVARENCRLAAEAVLAGQQRVARGRAGRGRAGRDTSVAAGSTGASGPSGLQAKSAGSSRMVESKRVYGAGLIGVLLLIRSVKMH